MDSPEQSASSSSLTGPSKECQKLEKASLILLDKCTKPRNSSDRMDQSLYTAGKEENTAYVMCVKQSTERVSVMKNVPVLVFYQCRGGQDRSLHHPQHRAGEDEVRRRGRPLPDGEDASHPAACHGADRGKDDKSCRDRTAF